MADSHSLCHYSPHEYICCGSCKGITVVQPKCQKLLDDQLVLNPYFDSATNTSYWSYKIFVDCLCNTKSVKNFSIPICKDISKEQITVYEKIDNFGCFKPVPFCLCEKHLELNCIDNQFNILKIPNLTRYEQGVEVVYLIAITGDYPVAKKPLYIKTKSCTIFFGCKKCFCIPGCHPKGKLSLTKKCRREIIDNRAVLYYDIYLKNIGSTVLENVEFEDKINIPNSLTVGEIKVQPPTLQVNTSVPGVISITGSFMRIDPGGHIFISYEIPIVGIMDAGLYTISNTAIASAKGTDVSDSCILLLPSVKLRADKICEVNDAFGKFILFLYNEGSSPDVLVDILDYMVIPLGVSIQFNDFNGCEAYYAGTTTPIPTNIPLAGPLDIDFICRNILVQSNSIYGKTITYQLVSSSVIGETEITNTLTEIVPSNPSEQIFLGVDGLPTTASINVHLNPICL